MPLYEYHCSQCHEPFEVLQSISSRDEPMNCKCGAFATRVLGTFNTLGKPYGHTQVARNVPTTPAPGMTAIHIAGGANVHLSGMRFKGQQTAVSIDAGSGAKLKMRDIKTENVSTLVEIAKK